MVERRTLFFVFETIRENNLIETLRHKPKFLNLFFSLIFIIEGRRREALWNGAHPHHINGCRSSYSREQEDPDRRRMDGCSMREAEGHAPPPKKRSASDAEALAPSVGRVNSIIGLDIFVVP